MMRTYQSTGDELKKEASGGGAEKLRNPVENSGDECDLTTESKSKSDGWVHMATGDVGSDCNRHEEGETMTHSDGNKPRRIKSRIWRQLPYIHKYDTFIKYNGPIVTDYERLFRYVYKLRTVGNGGTNTSENKEQSGDELSQVSS